LDETISRRSFEHDIIAITNICGTTNINRKIYKTKNFFHFLINIEFGIRLERKTFLFMIILCLSTYFPLSFISLFLHLKKLIINLNVISILLLSPLYLNFKIFYLEI
jgi:hypothetical protein